MDVLSVTGGKDQDAYEEEYPAAYVGVGQQLQQRQSPTLRSVFYPLLGERVWGWSGHIIDIVAVLVRDGHGRRSGG